jgi:glycosyltransferase involved in cell wall biosynthesis
MAQALANLGHHPVIIAHGRGRVIEEAERRGLETFELPTLSRHGGYDRPSRARVEHMLAFKQCMNAIKRLQIDLIHTNDLTILRTWAQPARASRSTFIAHWRAASRVSLSVSYAFRLAHHIISVSEYSRQFLPQWASRKTTVEYNSLEVFYSEQQRRSAKALIRAKLDLPQESIVVGIFGNLSRRKRSHVLADVVNQLATGPGGRPIYGLICGGPAEPLDQELYAKIEQYDLGGRLLMPGFVRPVHEWMAACDMILAPAEKEPLARNVLEAQALGVPVICSLDGGLTEIIEDGVNGVILPPQDVDAWVASVQRLILQPDFAAQLAERGQDNVRRLRPDLHARRIEAIYRKASRGAEWAAFGSGPALSFARAAGD